MAIIIQQLWDTELQRPVRIEDAENHRLKYSERLDIRDDDGDTHTYRVYRPRGEQPPTKKTQHTTRTA